MADNEKMHSSKDSQHHSDQVCLLLKTQISAGKNYSLAIRTVLGTFD